MGSPAGEVFREKVSGLRLMELGSLRILTFGLNQTAIGDGSLAKLTIEVNPAAAAGMRLLEFMNVSLSTPDAQGVPFKVHSDGSLRRDEPPNPEH